MEHLTDQLAALRQQAGVDREALKRATRVQKQRAERSENTAEQLSSQLFDMVGPRRPQLHLSGFTQGTPLALGSANCCRERTRSRKTVGN